jgi:quinol monooxygenase YgiN
MITRVVKLTFRPECVDEFVTIFEESKSFISSFEGNAYLALMKGKNNENIYFTISQWQAIENLEVYRTSDYFASVWSKTKVLFAEKAQAWTLDKIEGLGIWQE